MLERAASGRTVPEPTRADEPVDADYFALKTGLKRSTILRGHAGTDAVPMYQRKPRRWLKGDIDRFTRERAASLRAPKQKAHRLLDRRGRR
jgi:hypothetical protein